MRRGAAFGDASGTDKSPYRYFLFRQIPEVPQDDRTVTFVMLNPSTADARVDDPTIRRCMGFARQWGYGQLIVVNLFAARATNPADLLRMEDPVGPDNDAWIWHAVQSSFVVCAWGVGPPGEAGRALLNARAQAFRRMAPVSLYHLGMTKGGHPKHPLYLPKSAVLRIF